MQGNDSQYSRKMLEMAWEFQAIIQHQTENCNRGYQEAYDDAYDHIRKKYGDIVVRVVQVPSCEVDAFRNSKRPPRNNAA